MAGGPQETEGSPVPRAPRETVTEGAWLGPRDKPVVAIVGRPNVGKSTLFNRVVGKRAAIVEDLPGVTRDRQYGDAVVLGHAFIAIDTGGFEPETDDAMLIEMREQARIAIEESDVVVLVFDGHAGLLPADREIARMLMRSDRPVHFAVNKIDGQRHDPLIAEFYELGVETLWPISAQHGPGVLDLMEVVVEDLPGHSEEEGTPDGLEPTRIAVVGKPNAGKSTLVNKLLGADRLVVSDVPGTTRDSIDTWLELPPDPEVLAEAEAAVEALEDAAWVAADQASDGPAGVVPFDEGEALGGDPEGAVPFGWEPTDADELDEGALDAGDDEGDGVEIIRVGWEPEPDDAFEPVEPGPGGQTVFERGGRRMHGEASLAQTWLGALAADEGVAQQEAMSLGDEKMLVDARIAVERAKLPRRFLLIDTAGVRRRKWIKTNLERFSVVRSFKSIDRAEVCLLVLDATHGVTEQDARLASLVDAKGRACVILVNKWDIVPGKDTYTAGEFAKRLRHELGVVRWAPIQFISAKTGQRVHRILGEVERVRQNAAKRIPTGELNRELSRMLERNPPPVTKGRRLKIFYGTQVSVKPPTILLSCNDKRAVHFSYERYLMNQIRRTWDFEGTPVKLVWRARQKKARKGKRR